MEKLKAILAKKAELRKQAQAEGADLDAIEKSLADLEVEERQAIADVEKSEKRSVILGKLSSGQTVVIERQKPEDNKEFSQNNVYDSQEYRSAFFKKFAGAELTEAEQRAMTTASNSAGAVVPTATLNKILEKLQEKSIVYSLVSVSHLRGNVVIPIEGITGDVERKAEGEPGTVQEDTITSIELGAKKYIKLLKLTCELENTSIDALENYIVNKLVKKLEQAFDTDIINGTGTKGATGILTTITPLETASADTLTYDDICSLFGALSATAKKGATLMMSTSTLYNRVAKVKDDVKRPIFDVATNKVLGREVVECDIVPEDTIIFGDFSEYMFNWNKDPEIKKDDDFNSGDNVFRILALADGKLADLGAMKALEVKKVSTGS